MRDASILGFLFTGVQTAEFDLVALTSLNIDSLCLTGYRLAVLEKC